MGAPADPAAFAGWGLQWQAPFRVGVARPSRHLRRGGCPTPWRALRRALRSRLRVPRHGIGPGGIVPPVAFPVPGCLAAVRHTLSRDSQLAGNRMESRCQLWRPKIKPQAPLLVYPSVNSFKFQPCDHTPPGTQRLMVSHKLPGESSKERPRIAGRHRLWLRLRRYLIVFAVGPGKTQ